MRPTLGSRGDQPDDDHPLLARLTANVPAGELQGDPLPRKGAARPRAGLGT